MVLVLDPSTALYRSFLKHYTLTNKAVWQYDGTCPNLLRGDKALILVPSEGVLSALEPELASRRADHSLLWWMSLCIFDKLFLSTDMFV